MLGSSCRKPDIGYTSGIAIITMQPQTTPEADVWDPRTPRLTTNANLKENLNYTLIQIVSILYIFDVAITNTTCSHATKMTSNRKIMLTSYRNQEATGKLVTHVMECNKLQNLRN